MARNLVSFLCLFVGLIPTIAFAQRDLKDIPIPDAEEERKTFIIADGFEVNLFAADPLIHKPIQINFDPQGRLWVAASEVYPQIAPGQTANDKILILEDTDGNGTADKTTVFADGLLIPTGVEPGDGGAYVANSTELLHLRDTNGDGKADASRIVLSGFGTEDTHHIIHTFRWGPEGLFYFNQSIYIHSHVETPYGVRRLNAGGIWQFRPETLKLDVFARGWVNTWGHTFDKWGQSFATDGAGGEGINYVVPGAAYPTAYGVARILHGLNPGSPKYCGLEMVDGRHLPDDWQGNLIAHDFRGHRVCRFQVSDDGSGFASKQLPDLISSNHVAFRPIDVKLGPDGAIYIADWYNPIIQHGEVDFRDPRRDHTHGRIWRVTAKNRPLVPRPQLVKASVAELLQQLQSPESYTRHHAKRVLKERGAEAVLSELDRYTASLDQTAPQFEQHRLEALWMYQAYDVVRPELLKAVLASPEPRARAAAVRLLPHWADRLEQPVEWLASAVNDDYPRVRLEAVRSLAALPSQRSAELALAVVHKPMDQFLDYALWQTIRELRSQWMPAVVAGTFDDGGSLGRLLYALRAADGVEAIPALVQRLQSGGIPANEQRTALDLIATLGGPDQLRLAFELATKESTAASQAVELLRALLTAQAQRKVRPAGDLNALERLLGSPDQNVTAAAAEGIGAWQLATLYPALGKIALDEGRPEGVRFVAINSLTQPNQPEARKSLDVLAISDFTTDAVRAAAIAAVSRLDANQGATVAVKFLGKPRELSAQERVFQAFLQQKGAIPAFVKALEAATLPEDVAKIGLRNVTSAGRAEPALEAALRKAGGIMAGPKVLSPEEFAVLVNDVKQHGNATRGEALFRRADLNCLKCHAVGGAGGRVGPDLLSLGASAQVDYLVDSLLNPNKNVKEGFQTIVVQTSAGKVLSGVKQRQSENALIIRDVEDNELAIPLKEIEEQANGTSLMPAGLTEKLTRAELVDLVRFLSELGKPGPFAITPAPIARRWEVLTPSKESYTRLTRTSDAQLMSSDQDLIWAPAYTTVAGGLPVQELPFFETNVKIVESHRKVSFVRASVNVTSAGAVGWEIGNGTDGLLFWLNGKPIDAAGLAKTELPIGVHKLSILVDQKRRTQPLRLELVPIVGSSAQAQFVTGK